MTDWLRNANVQGVRDGDGGKVRDGGMRPYERGGRDKEVAAVVEGLRVPCILKWILRERGGRQWQKKYSMM